MSLMLAWIPLAAADRIVWASAPSDADRARAAEIAPAAHEVSIAQIGAWPAPDPNPDTAIATLAAELDACHGLFTVFDGELQIMARLQKALADVHVLRSEADAELVWRALVVQGAAVHRYYQTSLATDPAAAPYRGMTGGVRAWELAVALGGARDPRIEDIPEAPERIAFDAIRAATIGVPAGSVRVDPRPAGAVIEVDGRVVDPAIATVVVPGRHFVRVLVDGELVAWFDPTVDAGGGVTLAAPVGPKERQGLVELAKADTPLFPGFAPLVAGEPTWLAIPGPKLTIYRVDGGSYATLDKPAPAPSKSGYTIHAGLGAGWVSTGDFFLQNVDDGAPYVVSTVNAFAPAVQLGGEAQIGLFSAGAGVDLQFATGDWHTLPTGDLATSAFVWAHANVGVKWVQLAVGPLFPWYVGVGGQAQIPVWDRVQVVASGVAGIPITLDRGDDPAFTPLPAYAAWAGIGYRLH